MNFLPLAETSNSKMYLFLAIGAIVVLVFYFIKKAKAGKTAENSDVIASTDAPAEAVTETAVEAQAEPEKAEDEAPEIPHIPGYVVLDGVSEQDAAVVMAITAHQTGIDLARLDFKSIKRLNQNPVLENIEEQDAAVVMAITADKTGIPLENLIFNSIKLVED